ncbi:MAG: hypothetical protein ACE5FY_00775 [Nitrospiria bacterium]
MRQILHILKSENDLYTLPIIRNACSDNRIKILLIQEATQRVIDLAEAAIFVLSDDLKQGCKTPHEKIGYEGMLDLIFMSDSVIIW